MTSTDTLLPCEHCGCRFGYHEAGCAALVDDIVSVAVTGFKADMERIMAGHPETKPGDMTSEQQCMMVAEASGWRARALKAEAEIAASRTPPTPATEEREAVALEDCPIGLFISRYGSLCLKTEYGDNNGRIDAYIVSSGEMFWGDPPQTVASQRASMVTPVDYAAEILAAEARGYAMAIEDAANEARNLWEYGIPSQEFPRRIRAIEHGEGK